LGIVSFVGVVASIIAGKTRTWGYGWVYRAEEPANYWWLITIYSCGALLFLGIFLFLVIWPDVR
jgi:hypothetical protein